MTLHQSMRMRARARKMTDSALVHGILQRDKEIRILQDEVIDRNAKRCAKERAKGGRAK